MKVTIIGSGPAGLAAAYILADHAEVTIFDKGRDAEKRKCPSPAECIRTCKPCQKLTGVGGAGLFTDGKLVFSTSIGNNLTPVIGEEKNQALVDEVEELFGKYGIFRKSLKEEDFKIINSIKEKSVKKAMRFVYEPQTHIGTDKLKEFILNFQADLVKKGVVFKCEHEVEEVHEKHIIAKNGKENQRFDHDKLFIAPGREGASWLGKVVKKLKIEYTFQPIDIGVRVEVASDVTKNITDIVRDMKFYIDTETYHDTVRTFCVCPDGKVARETHEGFNLVNGHAATTALSPNTNFALLVTISLTKPLSNTNKYGETIARVANELGGGKPIVQRLGDLKDGRRSHVEKVSSYFVKPTMNDVVFGDISLVLPGRVLEDLKESLDRLDQIMPGIASDSTLLYAPEIKFHGLKIKTDLFLQTNLPSIYVGGDASGYSRGILGACCTGMLAAKGMLRQE